MNSTSRRRIIQTSLAAGAAVLTPAATVAQPAATPDSAQRQLVRMINGYRLSEMIYVAAKLGIADLLDKGPKTVSELASDTKSHADSLYRLLRALASEGVFTEEAGQVFRLNPLAEPLRTGVRGSVQALAGTLGEDWFWGPWGALPHSVKTGETAFDHLYGKNTFDWFKEHPEAAALYNRFQGQNTAVSSETVAAAYDFSEVRTIVDIGGGEGALLSSILGRNGSAHGVLFDLDHVVASARSGLAPGIAARVQFEPGDFFKAVPKGGDVYILKYILHDWEDTRAESILKAIHFAMNGRGKLLVVEDIVCGMNQPCFGTMADVNMLVRTGGRNRTEREYRDLLAKGGFKLSRTLPTAGSLSVMETVPTR